MHAALAGGCLKTISYTETTSSIKTIFGGVPNSDFDS